jgi:hypothetical protein
MPKQNPEPNEPKVETALAAAKTTVADQKSQPATPTKPAVAEKPIEAKTEVAVAAEVAPIKDDKKSKARQKEQDIVKILSTVFGIILLIYTVVGLIFLVYLFAYEAEPADSQANIGFPVVKQQQYDAAKAEYISHQALEPIDGTGYYDPFRLFRKEEEKD